MNITESKLKQIILEEVIDRLLEEFIEEELDKFLAESEEDEDLAAYKLAKKKDLVAKVKKGLLSTAVVGGLFGVLGNKTTDYSDIKAAEAEMTQQLNIEKANTDEAQLDDFADQLNNTARYMWGVGDQAAMPVPGTDGKVTVLPASYSLAVRAFLDKKANLERVVAGEDPIMRYGDLELEDLPEIGETTNHQGTYEENVKEFFSTYSGNDMVDAMAVLQAVPELDVVSGTGTEDMIIMVNPNKIDPNYVLPELGMTAQDYYNSQYGEFLGSGEKAAMELPDEEMTITSDGTELDPELIQKTKERAAKLKENKITWKNYRNRKKKLA